MKQIKAKDEIGEKNKYQKTVTTNKEGQEKKGRGSAAIQEEK